MSAIDYETFASDLPKARVFVSIEEQEDAFRSVGVDQLVRQLGKGEFRSQVAQRSTEQAEFFADRYNRAISIQLSPPIGRVGFLFPRSVSGNFLASGTYLSNDKLLFVPPGGVADIVVPALAGSEDITIPPDRFLEMADALCPTFALPKEPTAYEANPMRLRSLQSTVRRLVTHPEFEPSSEQISNLLSATITWMGYSRGQRRAERLVVNGARRHIAKQAQEFIEDNHEDSIHMEDLCRSTGVGTRTLQRAFRGYFDLTITDYLKAVRLDGTHRDLRLANPREDSVTDIALRHGFTHLGRFSIEFRTRFGESPRRTLATRTDQKTTPSGI